MHEKAGIVPISADQDTAGPMARKVTDAAVLLGAMTGVDPNDPATIDQIGNAFTDYTPLLDVGALQGARIGVWRELSFEVGGVPVNEEVSAIMADTIAALEAAGATIPFREQLLFSQALPIAVAINTTTGPPMSTACTRAECP